MPDNNLSLYFELKKGEKADLEVISSAAIAWVETLRATARSIDPNADIKVELVDADEGSLIFNTIIEWLDKHVEKPLNRISKGGGRLPRARKLLLSLATFLAITGYPTYDFYFGDESQFREEDRVVLEELLEIARRDPGVQESKRKFFRTLERDRSITAVGVSEKPKSKPIIIVTSDQFSAASGVWVTDAQDAQERITRPVLDVVLVKPALVHTPRAWTFKPDGLPEFEAVMRDPLVLIAIKERGLPERLREGIPMTIRLEVKEVMVDGEWKLARGGRSVISVITPRLD